MEALSWIRRSVSFFCKCLSDVSAWRHIEMTSAHQRSIKGETRGQSQQLLSSGWLTLSTVKYFGEYFLWEVLTPLSLSAMMRLTWQNCAVKLRSTLFLTKFSICLLRLKLLAWLLLCLCLCFSGQLYSMLKVIKLTLLLKLQQPQI